MTISRRQAIKAGVGTLPLLGLAGVAAAQQPGQPGQPGRPGRPAEQPGDAGMMASQDPPLAACLLIKGKKQIEVCRFALEKLQDADAKAFAQAEIDEHETMKKKLQSLGYDFPASPAGAGVLPAGDTATGRPGAAPPAVVVGRVTLPAGVAMLIDINREVGEQCVATARAELSKLEGAKFDKRFIGCQLDAHYDLFDHGVVFRKHASAQLAPALDEARKVIEAHIATCKQIMEKLDAMK